MSKPAIVSIGAGNVASHLIPALFQNDFPISCIFSRKIDNASCLAKRVNSSCTDKFEEIPLNADVYLISLTDHAISDAVKILKGVKGTVIHTAGSIGMEIFREKVTRFGVLYPVQTFNKTIELDLSNIPFLIEASDKSSLQLISDLARVFSSDIRFMNSEQRKWVHLAAIFACNFVNHMFTRAEQMLSKEDIDFKILIPLIEETIRKAKQGNPSRVQTGPAVRGNFNVVDDHARLLKKYPDLQNLYTFVTKMIYEYHQTLK